MALLEFSSVTKLCEVSDLETYIGWVLGGGFLFFVFLVFTNQDVNVENDKQ